MKPLDFSKIDEIRLEINFSPLRTYWALRLELWTRPSHWNIIAQLDDHLHYPA